MEMTTPDPTDDAHIAALVAYIEERISIDSTPALIVVDTLPAL